MLALSLGPLFFRSYGRGPAAAGIRGLLRRPSGRYVRQDRGCHLSLGLRRACCGEEVATFGRVVSPML